ncbi:hydantoinase/oxoprolinase N-terminal domain-containing protein [Pseudonocardia sp.]|uniref:hydantoinase/oxoprolinase N-terminal domain-containing protein n=1 Tax=Pseudonocardia sp. TaxID=60912 RepID=UPI003D1237F4
MGLRVAVDVGGTFTDVCVVGGDGVGPRVTKVPTTAHPVDAVLRGIVDAEVDLAAVESLSHGTTVATNALLNRSFRGPPSSPRRASATSSRSGGGRRATCGTPMTTSPRPTSHAATGSS